MKTFFAHPAVWLCATVLLLAACTFLPIRIQDDRLRGFIMRWVLVPVSLALLLYAYPVGIEVFRLLALKR